MERPAPYLRDPQLTGRRRSAKPAGIVLGGGLDEQKTKRKRPVRRRSHDLAYVLGEGASVGRNRVLRDAWSVAPLTLLNAALIFVIYLATIARYEPPRWDGFWVVATSLSALPVAISFVLVSLRDHTQPITVATFVTGVGLAVVVAVLSALRLFMSYTGVLFIAVPTVMVAIVIMLRLNRAQTEHVALLDFPGAPAALDKLGGNIPVIRGADADLGAFDRYLIDIGTHYSDKWSRFLLRSYMRGVLVTPWVQFLETRRGRVDIDSFDLSDVVLRPSQILYSRVKRLLDVALVILAVPFALIIAAGVSLYILLRAGRPILFRQERRGYGGDSFPIYKFRTMHRDAGKHSALDNDVRVVPGLALIRRLRFDEIPQLYNIWLGQMSWIGPRPATLDVSETTEASEPKYASRLLVRPGLTGWAQVNSGYASTTAEEVEKLGYDLYYVKHMSLDLDLMILARTVRILLFRTGAK
jgi:lipopolysaccharide/colanic/teichoic acid biosynthesis glycosyltransferase